MRPVFVGVVEDPMRDRDRQNWPAGVKEQTVRRHRNPDLINEFRHGKLVDVLEMLDHEQEIEHNEILAALANLTSQLIRLRQRIDDLGG